MNWFHIFIIFFLFFSLKIRWCFSNVNVNMQIQSSEAFNFGELLSRILSKHSKQRLDPCSTLELPMTIYKAGLSSLYWFCPDLLKLQQHNFFLLTNWWIYQFIWLIVLIIQSRITTMSSPRTALCGCGGCRGVGNLRHGLRAALRSSTDERVLLNLLQISKNISIFIHCSFFIRSVNI